MLDINSFPRPTRPILILGKGPSLDRRKDINEHKFFTIGINQVPNTDVAHWIDWEVMDFNRLANTLIICPYYPLLHREPHNVRFPDLPNVYCYNFSYAPEKVGESPVISNDGYSLHCIINLLIHMGIREAHSLGIDGGRGLSKGMVSPDQDYSNQFRYLNKLDFKLTRL
jgi:hypothetical protein